MPGSGLVHITAIRVPVRAGCHRFVTRARELPRARSFRAGRTPLHQNAQRVYESVRRHGIAEPRFGAFHPDVRVQRRVRGGREPGGTSKGATGTAPRAGCRPSCFRRAVPSRWRRRRPRRNRCCGPGLQDARKGRSVRGLRESAGDRCGGRILCWGSGFSAGE